MSYVMAAPEVVAATATVLAGIGSALREARLTAASPTVELVAAARDEVSASVTRLFSRYADDFQRLVGRATAFHEQFAQHLAAGAHSYASAEAVNVEELVWLLQNAGPWVATQALIEMLKSSNSFLNTFFQLLDYVLAPIRAVLGVGLLLLFFGAFGVLSLLANYLGQFGI
jgi:L-asparagine transporter-like permease